MFISFYFGCTIIVEFTFCFFPSPVTIGALNVITDVWSDIVSVTLLRGWLSNDMSKWKYDPTTWPTKGKYLDLMHEKCIKYDKSLLANLSAIKCETKIPLNMRLTLICRGLPIYNE